MYIDNLIAINKLDTNIILPTIDDNSNSAYSLKDIANFKNMISILFPCSLLQTVGP